MYPSFTDSLNASEPVVKSYSSAEPFPHTVIDDFLPQELYEKLTDSFPGVDDATWHRFNSGMENNKRNSTDLDTLPEVFRWFMQECNDPKFLSYLESVTGISSLIPDPEFKGGGLHKTGRGGKLGIHIDYNFHPTLGLDRRLNAILYLNRDWDSIWGGALEFWDEDVSKCVKKIEPKGNRLVIFNTDERSWHGHPDPLDCPPDVFRHSVAFYYYTKGRPETEQADEHNTLFRLRPDESRPYTGADIVRMMVPRIVRSGLKKFFRR